MAKSKFKSIGILILISILFGCVVKPITKVHVPTEPSKPLLTGEAPKIEPEPVTPSAISQDTSTSQIPSVFTRTRNIPKIGLIFSGGGAKAWAHIGVIKEIEKAKWPIHSVAGFEWGAAVAAVYANNISSNEIEWELSKVKDFENIEEISNTLFEKKSVSDLKVPFVCSSLNINKQIVYLLNRGQLNKLIPFCLAHPPLSKPYAQSIAEMEDIAGLAHHLRATGANKIVLINVLAQNTKHSFTDEDLSIENILWVKSAILMSKKIFGVDDIVNINLDNYGIKELDKKREIIAKGAEFGYDEIRKLTSKYGL